MKSLASHRLICFVILLYVPGVPVASANVFQLGPPPAVLGCTIDMLRLEEFGVCVTTNVNSRVDDAVSRSSQNYQGTINTLQSQVSTLQGQVNQLQGQLNQTTQQLGTPLIQALANSPISELNECLSAKGVNISAVMGQAVSDPAAFVRNYLSDMWRKNMAAASTLIGNPTTFGTVNGRPMSVTQRINQAEQIMGRMANQDPVGQCVWAISGPFRSQAKQIAAQIYPTMKSQYDRAVDQVVRPAVNRAVAELLRPMIRQFGSAGHAAVSQGGRQIGQVGGKAAHTLAKEAMGSVPDYVRNIALDVVQQYLASPQKMAQLIAELNSLASALRSNPSQVAQHQRRVERLLTDMTTFTDEMAVQIAIETMRRYGHAMIDTDGQLVIDEAFGAIQVVKDEVVEIATGIVAVFYEPAEAVGEVVAGIVEMLLDFGLPMAKKEVVTQLHNVYDVAMNQAVRMVSERGAPSNYIRRAGPLGTLLQGFPTERDLAQYLAPELAEMKNNLFAYHRAVLKLSQAVVPQGRKQPAVRPPIRQLPQPGVR